MKKILSFILAMMLMMGFMVAPVSAATDEVTIGADVVEAKPGNLVEIRFVASAGEVNFATYAFSFTYDDAILDYVEGSVQGTVFNPAYADDTAFATWSTGADVTYKGETVLFTAQFVVSADAKVGTFYPITLSIDNVRNAAGDYLTVATSDGGVKIVCPDHQWDEGKVTTEPTCTEKGVMTFTCKVEGCGATYTTDIDPLGHKMGDWVITSPASCARAGFKTRTCTVCDYFEEEPIPAGAHIWGDWVITSPASCTRAGFMTRTCTVCGVPQEEVIPSLGDHDWGDWVRVKDPTADGGIGQDMRTCKVCGTTQYRDVYPDKDQVPDTGVRSESYGAWYAVAAVVAGAAVAFVWKRKTAK